MSNKGFLWIVDGFYKDRTIALADWLHQYLSPEYSVIMLPESGNKKQLLTEMQQYVLDYNWKKPNRGELFSAILQNGTKRMNDVWDLEVDGPEGMKTTKDYYDKGYICISYDHINSSAYNLLYGELIRMQMRAFSDIEDLYETIYKKHTPTSTCNSIKEPDEITCLNGFCEPVVLPLRMHKESRRSKVVLDIQNVSTLYMLLNPAANITTYFDIRLKPLSTRALKDELITKLFLSRIEKFKKREN